MIVEAIQFVALLLLMLVTGVFWGPWFALHRTLTVFNEEQLILIVKTMSANLALPMRILMPSCIFCMLLSVCFFFEKDSLEFYLNLIAFAFTIVSLLITLIVEVPIVKQIEQWTITTVPSNWTSIRDRWVRFHVIRTFTLLISFVCFSASLLFT
jgi:uncharacterized membrane protein